MPLRKSILTILLLAACLPALAQNSLRTIHQERSLYRNILVTEDMERRCMRFTITDVGGQNQSCRYLDDHDKLVFPYARIVMSTLLVRDDPKRILIVGLGGGTLVHAYNSLFPDADITVVEIDEAVVRVAHDYFGFREGEHIHVRNMDGRVFVKRAGLRGDKYDLVILDAFNGDYIPEHLMTEEFLQEVKKLLPDDGMLVANTFSSSRLYDAESVTYTQVFGEIFSISMLGTGNRVIVATPRPLPDQDTLKARAGPMAPRFEKFGMDLKDYPRYMLTDPDWNENARPLTDQYSPANLLNN